MADTHALQSPRRFARRPLPATLDADRLAAFERDGFVIVKGLFTAREVGAARRAVERLERAAATLDAPAGTDGMVEHAGSVFVLATAPDGRQAIKRVVWAGAADPVLSALGRAPQLIALAGQLLGSRRLQQLINQVHLKRPGDGVDFPWHQDSTRRRYGTELWTDLDGRGSFVETVMAIDRMDESNGGLRIVPGSHHAGHLEHVDGVLRPEDVDEGAAVAVTLEPGDVVAFGPFVVHGSDANTSDRSRRTFLNGFALPGANHRTYPGQGSGRWISL